MTARAFLHVGAPKTGTTFLQGVLWANRDVLRAAGVHLPGSRQGDHYRAGHDLRDVPYDPQDTRVDWRGSWDALADTARRSAAPSVVLSEEHLAALTDAQAQRAVDSLAPREVHVIYAARRLSRVLPSEWQEFVKHGSPFTFADWSRRVLRREESGPGRWFWAVHDAADVVRRWSSAVPVERIHLMTVPRTGGDERLWCRFCRVLDVDASIASGFDVPRNTSLGLAETEVLRRLNATLPKDFARWHRNAYVRDLLAAQVLAARDGTGRPQLPHRVRAQLAQRSTRMVEDLRGSGCRLVGSWADLLEPVDDVADGVTDADGLKESAVTDAAVHALASLVQRMANDDQGRPRASSKLAARASVAADSNRAVRWLAERVRPTRPR